MQTQQTHQSSNRDLLIDVAEAATRVAGAASRKAEQAEQTSPVAAAAAHAAYTAAHAPAARMADTIRRHYPEPPACLSPEKSP